MCPFPRWPDAWLSIARDLPTLVVAHREVINGLLRLTTTQRCRRPFNAGIGHRQGQAGGDVPQPDSTSPTHAEHEERQGTIRCCARRAVTCAVQACNNRRRGDMTDSFAVRI